MKYIVLYTDREGEQQWRRYETLQEAVEYAIKLSSDYVIAKEVEFTLHVEEK